MKSLHFCHSEKIDLSHKTECLFPYNCIFRAQLIHLDEIEIQIEVIFWYFIPRKIVQKFSFQIVSWLNCKIKIKQHFTNREIWSNHSLILLQPHSATASFNYGLILMQPHFATTSFWIEWVIEAYREGNAKNLRLWIPLCDDFPTFVISTLNSVVFRLFLNFKYDYIVYSTLIIK